MRILDRLVAGTFLKLFGLVLAAAPPLFILGDITENLDRHLDRGVTGLEVAQAYLYQLPLFLQWSFPIAALVATVFTVHSMTAHREIVAAKAGGISFHRAIGPIFVAGLLLTVVALGLGEVVPRANRVASQILQNENPTRSWRSDFVYRSESGLTWQVSRLTAADGRMTGVVVERAPDIDEPALHVLAESAYWREGVGWTLQQGYLRRLAPDGTEKTLEFDQLVMTDLVERPEELLESPREADEMTYEEIERQASIIQRSGGDANRLLVKREEKIAIPVATLVIIMFGAPLATSSKRGGTAFGIGISLGIVILYMMLFKVSGALGEAGAVSPLWAAWTPNVLFFVGAVFLLARVRT
ncbi:MAG: LptF/LptG family permease [Gemmatimonadota bacterium]